MNKPDPHLPHQGRHEHGAAVPRKRLHHDWRFWIAVLLMLGAMTIYVLSLDESLSPSQHGEEQPAAVDGAGP